MSVQRMTDCMSLCQGEVHCHSFNIESHDHLDERLCELNNSSTAMHPFDLKERPGFLYYEEM